MVFNRRTFARERADVSFPSSATMVNDNLSSHVGLSVLAHLRSAATELGEAAARCEHAVRAALEGQFMGVCAVHGKGLMLAVRFDDGLLTELSVYANTIRPVSCAGVPPLLLLHAYLLVEHGVRARPTCDALMLDVPAVASDESVRRVCTALTGLVGALATEAFEEIVGCW